MSTRPTRSATVVERVRATGSHSDRAAAPRDTKDTAAPFVSHAQQAPPGAVGEFPVSGSIDEDTYFKLCDNLKTLKLGDSELSDSFEESIDHESDTTGTQDSDTGSFYSVQSHRTEKGADSFVSLFPLDSTSESTLYASAQSFQGGLPHSLPAQTVPSHDAVFREKRDLREHRSSLTFLPGHTQRFDQVYLSDPLEEYTSCPNLAPLEEYRLTPTAPVPCPAPALSGATTRRTMSTVDGATSPKSPRSRREEDGEKKKKGLISSFRKSRKTGRKLRQQKKAAEGDTGSVSTGVNSDYDSEPSAPSSPAIVKSQAMGDYKDGEDTEEPTGALDGHERLNGSAAPKEADPRSKTPSPTPKGTGVEEGNKKGEEKEEKKREKSKFGSFLRKEKKIKDSASKSSLASNASAASSQATDPSSQASADGVSTSDSAELRQEEKEFKNDTEQATAVDDDVNLEPRDVNRRPSDAKELPQSKTSPVQPRSTPVQFVKNFTVNTTVPKDKVAPESKPKLDADADQGDVKGMESADVKKNVKPASTETNSSIDKREHLYKILVIGELGTGKTSIIKRYVHQFFSQHYRATIGVDFALKVLNWDNNTVIRLQLWDIAGQERFGNMTRVYYKEAVGAFVVFDVTRAQTFDAVTKWKTDLDTKVTLADGSPIPTVLLANKCDQPKEGVVNNPARMDDYCRDRGFSGWFETSAKENINIDEASRFLVNRILNNEKQGMMMTESLDADKFSVDGRANPSDKKGCLC
ncbi:uncharacterized protein LOC126997423 isoform X1 [Eriocheir sinensis]|uniref:uncharacterized protein LOC126997423 isoform X1 n=1 Tax=Eriocheir sinensis TaxID=95602 RepID=UPI0021C72155|nr:uncharacterized protein LOC126997423 isoform X1 [Eriocheir sinensis]XP_050714465.1 uncharacterized protein LOC126997423 isoform X1 [Eriocheir sinensis]